MRLWRNVPGWRSLLPRLWPLAAACKFIVGVGTVGVGTVGVDIAGGARRASG